MQKESDKENPQLNSGPDSLSRREFLEFASAGVIAEALEAAFPPANASAEVKNGIPYRELGRTGQRVSLVGIGGYHLGKQADPNVSIAIIRKALDEGINFLDNCWDYNSGESEIRMGKALRDGYREKAFLMTKIDGRSKASATAQLEESLRRLQTDRIELLQFHEIIRDTDPDRIFSKPFSPRRKPARFASLGLLGTRVPIFISKCSPLRPNTIFHSTPFRCRSM